MDSSNTEARIAELERVRKETSLWRTGAFGIVAFAAIVAASTIVSDARALATPGPTQERFVTHLQKGLNEQVVPRLKDVAGSTLTEMQPIVQTEFSKLNERIPEVTEASLKQIEALQASLPQRSQKAIEETFVTALEAKEDEWRAKFPSATEENVHALVANFEQIARNRSAKLGEELLRPHLTAMQGIHKHLGKIATTEKLAPGEALDDWQLGLAVFDVLRHDLESKKTTPIAAPRKVAENAPKGGKA